MDKLTKDQKDEYAVSLAALALYDGDVSLFLLSWGWQFNHAPIIYFRCCAGLWQP